MSLVLLRSKASWLRFFLLWSTVMPMVLANCAPSPTALISARVNPLPSLGLCEYLMVWHLTVGLSLSRGLGEVAAALALLA